MLTKLHMIVGHCIEHFDKMKAMNYFNWAMKPYNKYPLYGEWKRLWEDMKISDLLKTGNIDLGYASKESLASLKENKDLTFKKWSENRLVNLKESDKI